MTRKRLTVEIRFLGPSTPEQEQALKHFEVYLQSLVQEFAEKHGLFVDVTITAARDVAQFGCRPEPPKKED